jgi:hypothetical protein
MPRAAACAVWYVTARAVRHPCYTYMYVYIPTYCQTVSSNKLFYKERLIRSCVRVIYVEMSLFELVF